MLRADLPRTGQHPGLRGFGQALDIGLAQLQEQALGHVARADAGRIEGLQQIQGRAQLILIDLQFGGQPLQDFAQRRAR